MDGDFPQRVFLLGLATVATALLLGLALWSGLRLTAAAPAGSAQTQSELLLVGLVPHVDRADIERQLAEQDLRLVRAWPDFDLMAVQPVGSERSTIARQAALQRLQALSFVRFAEPDARIEAAMPPAQAETRSFVPSDVQFEEQWALQTLGMPAAWQIGRGDPSLVVAIIDSGVDLAHEDLDASTSIWRNVAELEGRSGVDDDENGYVDDWQGWDWVDGDNSVSDGFGHGTHVAGTLVAAFDNEVGVAGMAPGMRILPLRVLDAQGSGFVSDLISALDYVRAQGAQIVNLSLVLRFDSRALHNAVRQLHADGTLVIAATGNYDSRVQWPAAYTETLAVAATNRNDSHAFFSNAGPEVDLAAPGEQILSLAPGNGYIRNDGTSMAVPHVAALAGLIWTLRPDLDREGVLDLMRSTAMDANEALHPGRDEQLGWGRIDAAAALRRASEALLLDVAFPDDLYLSVNQPLQIPIQLAVTGTAEILLPVRGAVVHYDLRGPSAGSDEEGTDANLVTQGVLVTDEFGHARLDLVLPAEAGAYTLQATTGQQQKIFDFRLQDGPLVLSLSAQNASIPAGTGRTEIVFQARTAEGALLQENLSVALSTSLGSFGDGSQMQTVVVEGGLLTRTLHAGPIAGTADLAASAAGQTHRARVLIEPGRPHRIVGPATIHAWNDGRAATADLHLEIVDRYGNRVWSSEVVNFYALTGRFSPESPRTLDGRVSTTLTLPSWAEDPAPIWGMVPGTFAIYRAKVLVHSHRLHLPIVRLRER